MPLPDYKVRIILLGNCNVGKTSYTRSFVEPFNYKYMPTVGVEYGSATTLINNTTTIKCQIWDTAGNEKFASIISCYYKNIAGVIIMFDLTSYDSFRSVTRWHNEILNKLDIKQSTYFPIILVGNKSDLGSSREVMLGDCIGLSTQLGCTYMETSVKKGDNTLNIVKYLIKNIIENITQKKVIPGSKNGIYISYKGENKRDPKNNRIGKKVDAI